jgi:hypothetical protein
MLQPYLERFPRERILLLRFDDIVTAPRTLAGRLHEFLGVRPRPEDAESLGVINPSNKPDLGLSDEIRRALADRYEEPNRRLAAVLGPEFALWR